MRIVSLLPSATEIVCVLGLGDQLVGVTHECDYPTFVRGLPKVTRTLIPRDASSAEIDALVRERLQTRRALYSLDLPALEQLKPDLIITQALCDVCAVAEEEVRSAACSLPGSPPVINLEPKTWTEVLDSIRQVGRATGSAQAAESAVVQLHSRVAAVAARSTRVANPPRVVLLEWIDPPFCCGHWTPELVSLAGGRECLGEPGTPSRTLKWGEVQAAAPDVMIVACCGFDVARTRQDLPLLARFPGWSDLPCARQDHVYLVDGSAYFSRPGPRLVDSLEILAHALHPNLHPLPAGLPAAEKAFGNPTSSGEASDHRLPFPPYTFVPGKTPHPRSDPAGHSFGFPVEIPTALDPAHWQDSPTYRHALDLFDHQFYWEAHEQFEALWLAAGRSGQTADFLKALIKLSAAGVKHLEGSPAGVQSHASRAEELLRSLTESIGGDRYTCLSIPGLLALSHRIATTGWPQRPPVLRE
jgi:iron complex transport system substrate-binding protein